MRLYCCRHLWLVVPVKQTVTYRASFGHSYEGLRVLIVRHIPWKASMSTNSVSHWSWHESERFRLSDVCAWRSCRNWNCLSFGEMDPFHGIQVPIIEPSSVLSAANIVVIIVGEGAELQSCVRSLHLRDKTMAFSVQ